MEKTTAVHFEHPPNIMRMPDNKEGWKLKAMKCITSFNCYTTTVDILRCVLGESEYSKLGQADRKDLITNISVTLNNLVVSGYIKKAKLPGMKGNFYGLPKWFHSNGDFKIEYADNNLKTFLMATNQLTGCCD